MLKVMIAIGGWNEGSPKYSRLAQSPQKRKQFVRSVVQFLRYFFFEFWENLSEFLGNIGLKAFKLKQGMLSYRL